MRVRRVRVKSYARWHEGLRLSAIEKLGSSFNNMSVSTISLSLVSVLYSLMRQWLKGRDSLLVKM